MLLTLQTLFLILCACVSALTPAQWRSQSIYQVITDRFARTDGSTTAPCDLNRYCGGTWQGLINNLEYIQNMGFSAVRISCMHHGCVLTNRIRSGSRPLCRIWRRTLEMENHTTATGRRTSTMSTQTSDLPRTSSNYHRLCMPGACT